MKHKWLDAIKKLPEENKPYFVISAYREELSEIRYDPDICIGYWEFGEFRDEQLQELGARWYLPFPNIDAEQE